MHNSTTPSGCKPVGELYILPECAPVLDVFVGLGRQVTCKPLLQQATRILYGHEPLSCLPCMPQSHAGQISRAPDYLNFLHKAKSLLQQLRIAREHMNALVSVCRAHLASKSLLCQAENPCLCAAVQGTEEGTRAPLLQPPRARFLSCTACWRAPAICLCGEVTRAGENTKGPFCSPIGPGREKWVLRLYVLRGGTSTVCLALMQQPRKQTSGMLTAQLSRLVTLMLIAALMLAPGLR